MAKCKGCGAEIIWIMSPSGKVIPCDPEVVYYSLARGGFNGRWKNFKRWSF